MYLLNKVRFFLLLFFILPINGNSQTYVSNDDYHSLGYKTMHDSIFKIGDKIIFPGLVLVKNEKEKFINVNLNLINALHDFVIKNKFLVFDIEVHSLENLNSSQDINLSYAVWLQNEIAQQSDLVMQRLRPRSRGSIHLQYTDITNDLDSATTDSLNIYLNNRVELHVTSILSNAFYEKHDVIQKIDEYDVNKIENAKYFILAADYYFMNNEMEKALKYYQIAQRLIPNDVYINKQINLIGSSNH